MRRKEFVLGVYKFHVLVNHKHPVFNAGKVQAASIRYRDSPRWKWRDWRRQFRSAVERLACRSVHCHSYHNYHHQQRLHPMVGLENYYHHHHHHHESHADTDRDVSRQMHVTYKQVT